LDARRNSLRKIVTNLNLRLERWTEWNFCRLNFIRLFGRQIAGNPLVHRRETEQVPALYLTRFAWGGLGKLSRALVGRRKVQHMLLVRVAPNLTVPLERLLTRCGCHTKMTCCVAAQK
jgi:hypothetical protein